LGGLSGVWQETCLRQVRRSYALKRRFELSGAQDSYSGNIGQANPTEINPCRYCWLGNFGAQAGGNGGGQIQERVEESVRPLTWDERHALKKMLTEGCPDFVPYKEKGHFKKFLKKAAKDFVELWIPVLGIVLIAAVIAGGLALAILKIFSIGRG
jgi:hypothetical protein